MNSTFPIFDLSAELNEVRRENAARRIAQSLIPVHANAHRAAGYMRHLDKTANKLRGLFQLNSELVLTDQKRIAAYILIWIASLATYFLDVVLIAAVAEYFARRVYTTPFMVTFAQIVIPAAILIIELLISSHRALAHEEYVDYGHSRHKWVWVILTLLILCVLPSMVAATHFATLPTTLTPSLEMISRYQLIGIISICLVLHCAVLHGGKVALEAQAYFWFKLRSISLERKIRRRQDSFDAAATLATNSYIEHIRFVRDFNARFPESQMNPGPFDKLTKQLLLERFDGDYDLTSLPNDGSDVTTGFRSRTLREIPARERSMN